MKCNEALLLMDSVLDGEATAEEEQLLRFHVNGCLECRKTLLLNRSISEKITELEEPEVPSDLLDKIQLRLSSENYDHSPVVTKKSFRFPTWRIAAVIPFAAALVFLLQNFAGDNSNSYGNTVNTASARETDTQYAPTPVVAYSRPSSVSTF